jgi:DNA-binding SARP family transcriptional activator
MFRLRTFGGLSLESDGVRVAELNAQRKALALLAVLARSRDAGVGREKLMALLWADSDMDRARGALKQMLHGIRRQLGAPGVVTGTSELSLDRKLLSSDVADFTDAIARGDLEAAVTLYRGPFLDAVHVDRAPEFSRWQDAERAELANAYLDALERLARAADEAGKRDEAVSWWRQLSAADPLQSRGAVGLMRSLEAAGDRAGALRVSEQHQVLLRDELDAKPDADVAALAAHLRSTSLSFPRRESISQRVAETLVDRTTAPTGERRARGLWTPIGAVIAGVAIVAAAVLLIPRGSEETPVPHPGKRIVVAMFANQTGDSTLDPLRLLAADWMTRAMARTPSVDVLYPGVLYSQGQGGEGIASLPMDLARNNGAHFAIAGNYYMAKDTLYFSASLIDVGTGKVIRVLDPVAAVRSEPLPAIEELRKRTSVALEAMLDARVSGFLSSRTYMPRLDAYREFIVAEDLHWRGDVVASLPHFARALDLDSAFMLAAARMIASAAQAGRCDMVDSLAREFSSRLDELSFMERPTFGRAVARCDGDREAATRHDRDRAAVQPTSPILQWLLATSLRQSNRPAEALAIMSTLDPDRDIGWLTSPRRLFYWRELGSAQHAIGDYKGESRTADGIARDNPNHTAALYFRARSLAGANNPGRAVELLEEIDDMASRSTAAVSAGSSVPSAGWTIYNISEELLAHGHRSEAVAAARRTLKWLQTREDSERNAPAHRLLRARALEMTGNYDEAAIVVSALLREDPESISLRAVAGVLAARRGDPVKARGISASLATGRSGDRSERARVLARAQIAAAMGNGAEAVSLLRSIPHRSHPGDVQLFHSDPAFYALRDNAEFKAFVRPRG